MNLKDNFVKGIEKIDERLLKGRLQIEGNLIACFGNDITLIDDLKLDKTKFLTKDGRFYFSLFKALRDKHINKVDEVTVMSCDDNIKDALLARGGYEALSNLIDVVSVSNFDSYYEEFNRGNLLIHLYQDGFNLFQPIKIKNKEIVPFEIFQRFPTEKILDFYESKLSGYDIGQSAAIVEEEDLVFEDNWEETLEEGDNMGTPYDCCGIDIKKDDIKGFKSLSDNTLGLHHSDLMMLAGFSGVGKSTMFIPIIMALLFRGEKGIIISNEEKIQKFKIKFMSWLLANYCHYFKCTKSKLTKGTLTDEDKAQIKIAKEYFNNNYGGCLKFIAINTNDMSLIKNKIKDAHLKRGHTFFLLDTFKLADDNFNGERQDLSLVKDSRELHALAMKYNMIGMCSCQCGERFKGALTLTATVLSGSKQIKEMLAQLFMCRQLYNEEELDPQSKYYCSPFKREKIDGKWREEKVEVDPSGTYIVVALEKNRDGTDTGSTGVSYLLKFEGHLSSFREVCMVRTKHASLM